MKKLYEEPSFELIRFLFEEMMGSTLDNSDPESDVESDGDDSGIGDEP